MANDRDPVIVVKGENYVVYSFHVPLDQPFRPFIGSLLRRLLGEKINIAPEKLEFSTKNQGKPILGPSQNTRRLSFNLSHSEGKVLLGIALPKDDQHTIEIGVDLQRKRPTPILKLAKRFFHPRELERLEGAEDLPSTLPSSTRARESRETLFFEYWTLKEAWVKCRGENLASHLKFDIHEALTDFTVHHWNDTNFAYAVVIRETPHE
jgi:4'-phosphopantetheinyl transferase